MLIESCLRIVRNKKWTELTLPLKRISFSCRSDDIQIFLPEMLVEDGLFEAKIPLPVALMAELFWSAEESHDALIERVAKYPCVSI